MIKLACKILKSNIFISSVLHIIVILISGLSFLFVSASTINLPPPIEVTFIGVPKESSAESPRENINKEIPKETPSQKTPVNPPRKIVKKTQEPEIRKTQKIIKKEPAVSPKHTPETEKIDPVAVTEQASVANHQQEMQQERKNEQAGIAYEQALLGLLSKVKKYPERARRRGISGDGIITLRLHRNGTVRDVTISSSTGHSILDKELLAMVHRAAPLPPLPQSYRKTDFIIPVSFSFTE